MKSLKNIPFRKGDRGGFLERSACIHGIESSEMVSRQQFIKRFAIITFLTEC